MYLCTSKSCEEDEKSSKASTRHLAFAKASLLLLLRDAAILNLEHVRLLPLIHLDAGILTIEENRDLLESLALGLNEPTIGDEALNSDDRHIDDVVLPANVCQADWVDWFVSGMHFRLVFTRVDSPNWLTNTAALVENTYVAMPLARME
jgi:hypothetical protein